MKLNYIIIPLITIATALLGSILTSGGMDWYKIIAKPSWTPPGSFIGAVWTILFILATISALAVFNSSLREGQAGRLKLIVAIFILNAILNVSWSLLFFNQHLLGAAVFEAGLLGLSVVALVILIWPVSRLSASLLIPYAAWVFFATFLTYKVLIMN